MDFITGIIGKFHPLLVHLPIGILIYAYLHYAYCYILKPKDEKPDLQFALCVGMLSAIAASISGYLLSLNGEYDGNILEWHKWAGIGTALISTIVFIKYNPKKYNKVFFILFTVLMGLITLTGHYGGTITHGEGFISFDNVKTNIISAPIENIDEADIYQDIIMPIIDSKCVSCHNPKKTKGDLLLHNLEGWQKGGSSGALITLGNKTFSLLNQRIHLPKSSDEHMPPSGKQQLSNDEVKIIDWWVSSMSSYDQTYLDLQPTEEIQTIIKNKQESLSLNIKKASKATISNLQSAGYIVHQLSENSPWLDISFPSNTGLKKSKTKLLLEVKDQLVKLDLSNTDLNDKATSPLSKLKNLKSLNLSKTSISSDALNNIANLKSLQTLNLYGCKVDKSILSHVETMKNLQSLYLWQTNITKEDLSDHLLKKLTVNIGQDMDSFEKVELSPPTIVTSADLFMDSLMVVLESPAKKGKTRYTLDGTAPNNTSPIYSDPFYIKETTTINAITEQKGWTQSKVATRSIIQAIISVNKISITPAADESYKSNGDSTLIDFVKSDIAFGSGKWLGWAGQDINIDLDLGSKQEVSMVSIGCLQDVISYIFLPTKIEVYTSVDGQSYDLNLKNRYPTIPNIEDSRIRNFIEKFSPTQTQYIRIKITGQKKNPSWHPAPGAPSWLFIDEVTVG